MSPNLRKWLLIGGGIVVGLVVLLCLAFFLLSRSASLGGAAGSMALDQEQAAKRAASGESFGPAAGLGGAAAPAPGQPPADMAALPTQSAVAVTNQAGQQQDIQRLIIRNGNITVSVSNTYDARNKILGNVGQMAGDGAFVVSVQESGGGGDISPYINMVIRVPAAKFADTMNAIAGLAAKGTTAQRNETAQDVTAEYVDVKGRADSMELARQRLQQIMAAAQNTADLLQAEQQLTQREADIEALKGRMQYLEQSAALSEITIQLTPYILSQPVDTSWRPGETFRRALDNLIGSLRDFADFLIVFAVSVLPWLVVFGLVIWGIVRFVMSRVRRNREKQPAAMPPEES